MNIIIEGADGLVDGVYGSYAITEGDTLKIFVDPELAPEDSAYPITVGSFA